MSTTSDPKDSTYDPAADPVHGSGWNPAARWGGWHWSKPGHGEHFRRCSFCGSIHPEDLAAEPAGSGCGYPLCPEPHAEFASIHFPAPGEDGRENGWGEGLRHRFAATGWRADWADGWPHKFYADIPNRNPGALFVVGTQSGGQARPGYRPPSPLAGKDGIGWVAFADLTGAQRKMAGRDGCRIARDDHSDFYQFGTRSSHFGKFYTAHLADPAISQEAKDVIGRVSGLRFRFEGGQVSWEALG